MSPAFVLTLTVAVDLQFEREDEGKLQEILNKYGLQSLYPLEGIQSFLPKALAEVCITTTLPVALRQLWSSTVHGVKLSASVHVPCGLPSVLGPYRNLDIGRGSYLSQRLMTRVGSAGQVRSRHL